MLRIIITSMLFLCSAYTQAQHRQWDEIAPGLAYLQIPTPSISTHGQIHAFKVSLSDFNLGLAFAEDYDKLALSTVKLAHKTGALVTINGGFFSPNYQPLGLRIQNGNVRSPLKSTSWWGVFYIKNDQAHIVPQRQYRRKTNPDFAIQAGPRLLVNGSIPKLKGGYAERSALCINREGEVIITITEHAPLTTTQFAKILQRSPSKEGVGCYQALNLDGGSSSQLFAQLPGFSLKVISFHDVTDVVIVQPKQRAAKSLKVPVFIKHDS